MDLSKTDDFLRAFYGYCHSIEPSCLGCQIQVLSSIDSRDHKTRDQCLVWALHNAKMSVPILQDYLNSQPFIPGLQEDYYYTDTNGDIMCITHWGRDIDYAFIAMRNCFRTAAEAMAHKDEIMAKYKAIDDGRYPD